MLSRSTPDTRATSASPSAREDVHAQRQRHPRLGQPPGAEVDGEVQPALAVRETPLVNEQGRVDLARLQRLEDAPERRDGDLHADRLGRDQAQHQPRRGRGTWNPDPRPPQVRRAHRPPRHHHRPEPPPHRGPVWQKLVARRHHRIRADRDGHDVGPALGRQAVQRRRVVAPVLEREPPRVDAPLAQGVEHEGVVRIYRISKGDDSARVRNGSGRHRRVIIPH
jgi:hypothetical protein